jgi:hypothetical protein
LNLLPAWTAGVVKAVAVAEGRALPVHNKIYSPQRPGEQERLNRSCPIARQQKLSDLLDLLSGVFSHFERHRTGLSNPNRPDVYTK